MFSTPPGPRTLSPEEMKFSYWYVTHQVQLRRFFILALAAVDLILIMGVLYGLLSFYVLTMPQTNAIYASLARPALDYQYLSEMGQAQPVVIGAVQSIPAGDGVYDFVADVTNPNELWYAKTVTYHFTAADVVSATKTDFLLPGQTKSIMELGTKLTTSSATVQFVIDDIRWEKVPHFQELSDKVLKFTISDARFLAPQESGATDAVPVSRVSFSVKNDSAYNFANVTLKVLLYRGQTLVGVNEIPVDRFDSVESQVFEYLVYHRMLPATVVTVVPDVDILNPANFLSFNGVGEPK